MPRITGKIFGCAALLFLALIASAGARAANALPYRVLEVMRLPGSVSWDYLTFDIDRRRLFVTRGDRVDVLNTASNRVISTISGLAGAHGVALAPGPGYGYISDGKANDVVIFDYATLEPIATLPAGKEPDAIVYDDAFKRVFVANGGSGDLTIIDAATNQIMPPSLALDGKPEAMVADGMGRLYVDLQNKGQIAVIDTRKLEVIGRYNISAACTAPTGLALDKATQHLFVSCRDKRMVVADAATGRIIDALPIGAQTDGAAFDPGIGLAFSANGEGTLTVAGPGAAPGHTAVLQILRTLPTARTLTLDPLSHLIYISAAVPDRLPSPTYQNPHPQRPMKPNSFMIMIVAPNGWGRR